MLFSHPDALWFAILRDGTSALQVGSRPFSFLPNTRSTQGSDGQAPPNLHLMTTLHKRLLFPTESTMKKSSLFGFPRVRLRKRIDDTCYLPVFSV